MADVQRHGKPPSAQGVVEDLRVAEVSLGPAEDLTQGEGLDVHTAAIPDRDAAVDHLDDEARPDRDLGISWNATRALGAIQAGKADALRESGRDRSTSKG